MEYILTHLTHIRKQLVIHQSSINNTLEAIDDLIFNQLGSRFGVDNKIPTVTNNSLNSTKKFPKNISTKRDKLKYILEEAGEPITAKEVKKRLLEYGEELPNVDQSLVNLERDEIISSDNDNGMTFKKYFMKK